MCRSPSGGGRATQRRARRVGFALPPIIVTLATMSLWQGVALLVLPQPGGEIPEMLPEVLSGSYILPVALWLIIAVLGFGDVGDEHAVRPASARDRR